MTKAELKALRWLPVCLNDVRRRIADLQQLRCSPESPLYAPRRVLLELYQRRRRTGCKALCKPQSRL